MQFNRQAFIIGLNQRRVIHTIEVQDGRKLTVFRQAKEFT